MQLLKEESGLFDSRIPDLNPYILLPPRRKRSITEPSTATIPTLPSQRQSTSSGQCAYTLLSPTWELLPRSGLFTRFSSQGPGGDRELAVTLDFP